ncbi:MAG: hypothetical protein HQL66_14830 [Magnetococcales bacterium]|nr:hypothetical protein [Magnetococcales bacterium]
MSKMCFKTMHGGNKKAMKERADRHYEAVKLIIPNVSRMLLFDYDRSDEAFHPLPGNTSLVEWQRKNIENYLLVPDAWKRAANQVSAPQFADDLGQRIEEFFAGENLTLPPNKNWRNVTANVFCVVDGKRILFENDDSLFHRLRKRDPAVQLLREKIAHSMLAEEIHEDVHHFFQKLKTLSEAS